MMTTYASGGGRNGDGWGGNVVGHVWNVFFWEGDGECVHPWPPPHDNTAHALIGPQTCISTVTEV